MLGRKIQLAFAAISLIAGVSCFLNPQPEPPGSDSPGGGIGVTDPVGGPSGSPITGPADDAGALIHEPDRSSEAGAERQDSSNITEASVPDAGAVDAEAEASDSTADSSDSTADSSDAGAPDGPQEGATTGD